MDLSSIKKEEVFQVPEGYFDELEESVMGKVRRHRRMVRTWKIAAASAAAVILILCVNLWIFMPEQQDNTTMVAQTSPGSNVPLLAANTPAISGLAPAEIPAATPVKTVEPAKTNVKHSSSSNHDTADEVIINESELDNADYQILDYYTEELAQMDYWF